MNSLVEHRIKLTQTYILEEESHSILIHLPIKQHPFLAPAAASIQQLEDKLAASRSLLIIVEEEIFWPEAQRSYKNIKLALWENLPHLHPPPPPGPIHTEYTQSTHRIPSEYTQEFVFDSVCNLSVVHWGQSSFSGKRPGI